MGILKFFKYYWLCLVELWKARKEPNNRAKHRRIARKLVKMEGLK